ncbi:MAG: alpha/beta fold hydrolase [Tildeniella nuda ZEHNDER 1965/U140]|jgi:carboxylesterase|nr:alpha/beta fold hydrolase [Tildeniella nuda ZEHNDER 1965/U140]
MSNYSALTTTIAAEAKAREDALPVRNESCRSKFFFHPQPTQKVCLFFHGFTGYPNQFLPLSKALYQKGYNVLVPLLPGHGQAGNWNRDRPTPLPTDPKVYQDFALAWIRQAQALGQQVVVGGLSGGGTLCGWLALEHRDLIDRALLFAPYLSGNSITDKLFIKLSNSYYSWGGNPDLAIGYTNFQVPALRLFLDLGAKLLKQARTTPAAPMFIFSTEIDDSVDTNDHKAFFADALQFQPKCWYHCFDRTYKVPHTMMTIGEGNQWEGILNLMAKAYVESDLTWAEVEEIGFRLTQGKTFPNIVAELGISDRAGPDMPAMMTMVDKAAIVQARNPSMTDNGG